ncbi:MAG: hypothetical protein ACK51L_03715 [bacterium]
MLNKAQRRTVKKAMDAAIHVIKDEATQEMKINVHVFRLTDLNPFAARADLTTATTIVWVVEMGM